MQQAVNKKLAYLAPNQNGRLVITTAKSFGNTKFIVARGTKLRQVIIEGTVGTAHVDLSGAVWERGTPWEVKIMVTANDVLIENVDMQFTNNDTKDWFTAPTGVRVLGSNNRINNAILRGVRIGVDLRGTDNAVFNTTIQHFSEDGIRVHGDRCRVSTFDISSPQWAGAEDIHADGIQIFARDGADTVRDLRIEFGKIYKGPHATRNLQGIIQSDDKLERATIFHVACEVDTPHGITLGQPTDCVVESCVAQSTTDAEHDALIWFGSNKLGFEVGTGNKIIQSKADKIVAPSHVAIDTIVGKELPNNSLQVNDSMFDPAQNLDVQGRIPRGIRNNNPGNLEFSPANKWHGMAVHDEMIDYQQEETRFCVFTTPAYGIRALVITLKNYQSRHKLKSVAQIINRYAPRQDNNNTAAYIDFVCTEVGVKPKEIINVRDYATCFAMVRAIIQKENGIQPYDDMLIQEAIAMAGVSVDEQVYPAQHTNGVVGKVKSAMRSTEIKAAAGVGTSVTGLIGIEASKHLGISPELGRVVAEKAVESAGTLQTMSVMQGIQIVFMGVIAVAAGVWLRDRWVTRKMGVRR